MLKSEKNFFEKILDKIPGLKGYRERDDRRTTDKRLREYLARRLDIARGKISEIKLEYTNKGMLDKLDEIGELERRLMKLTDSIRYASYGYSGLFDQLKMGEEELNKLYEHDLSFLEAIEELENLLKEKNLEIKEVLNKLDLLVEDRKVLFEKL